MTKIFTIAISVFSLVVVANLTAAQGFDPNIKDDQVYDGRDTTPKGDTRTDTDNSRDPDVFVSYDRPAYVAAPIVVQSTSPNRSSSSPVPIWVMGVFR